MQGRACLRRGCERLYSLPQAHFSGKRDGCLQHLRGSGKYYVYVLRRPDGRPFYVGKGIGYRIFNHESEASHPNGRLSNAHKLNVIRSIRRKGGEIVYEIVGDFESESEAYQEEERLISKWLRLHEGGPLTNRAPGGGSIREASPYSKAKHAATLGGIPEDDPETGVLNAFVLDIANMRSVVLKPLSRFVPKPTAPFEQNKRLPSLRQAAALAATAAANGIPLDGPARLPRRVVVDGVDAFVENGVARDIVTSGMATIIHASNPSDEHFELTQKQAEAVVGLIGRKKAFEIGLLGVIA